MHSKPVARGSTRSTAEVYPHPLNEQRRVRHTGGMHAALFYLPGTRLSLPELISARLDGLVSEVGEGFMPADIAEGSDARATAISPLLPRGYAASGPTAAWIHGAGDVAPAQHHAQRCSPHRSRVRRERRIVVHESQVPAEDLISFDRVWATSAQRTLLDLALGASRHPDYLPWGLALQQARPTLVPVVRKMLDDRERIPGKRAACALLEEWSMPESRQEDVTR